jgi:hypothetical protein
MDYQCSIAIILDPGSALHKPLPQSNPAWDTLGTLSITDPNFGSSDLGVNLNSNSQAVDIIQRMATSTYRFVLHGYGIRVGYKIPIPFIANIGNLVPVPTNPQYCNSCIIGSIIGGIPVWQAEWESHYIIAQSPRITQANQIPAAPNPAAHVGPQRQLPPFIQGPQAAPDYNTVIGGQPPQTTPGAAQTGRLGVFLGG